MSERSPDSARSRCQRASDSLQRAATLLEQTEQIKQSIARMRVTVPPAEPERRQTPTVGKRSLSGEISSPVTLIRGFDGVLRVKKD